MFRNYLKTALRNLWKNKTNSFLNIAGLSIGITCAALIFLWVEDEVNYDSVNLKKTVLYKVYQNQSSEGKIFTVDATPGPLAAGIKTEIPGVKNSCRTTWQQTVLFSRGDKNIREDGLYADTSIFSMFTLPFVQGNPVKVFDQVHSIVITEKMAKKFFSADPDGYRNIVGKTLKVDNKDDYIITGVIKDLPENSTMQFSWLAPFQIHYNNNQWLQYWGSNGIQTFVELDPTANVNAINKKFSNYIQSKDAKSFSKPFLFSMKDWRLRSDFQDGKSAGGRIQYVRMFSIIAWIILLIACINFMNLATARSEKRAKEIGVRKVLGAVKRLLAGQFIGEALLMSLLAVLFASGIMYLVLPSFNTLVEKNLVLGLGDPFHVLSLIAIGVVCGLLAGSYPSLYLSSFNAISALKGLKIKSGGATFIRKGLVVIQFSISVILIISTIIIYQQIQHVKDRPLGYNKDNLLQINLKNEMKKNYTGIKQDLLATGNIENVAQSMLDVLYMGSTTTDFSWQGKDPKNQILLTQDWISPEYISTTGMQIRQGRNFYSIANQDSASVIVNETLAKLIDKENAVGKIVNRGKKKFTVVGVASDVIYGDMYGNANPMIFLCYPANNYNFLYLRLRNNGNTEHALANIQTVIKKYDPDNSADYKFVDDDFNKIFQNEMLTGKLSRIFAVLAIFISCLGLFGLAAYTAEKRTKEIGIRKVLGASVQGITALLSKDFLKLVFISIVIAFPFAWWLMNMWLQDYTYRINISWWIFIAADAAALLIALFTVCFQAIKAAIANPVKSLRTE